MCFDQVVLCPVNQIDDVLLVASHHIDSGFSDDEHWPSTSRTEPLTSSDQHSSANNIDQSYQKDYMFAIASNNDFVLIRLFYAL
jgi:hypothetical protein